MTTVAVTAGIALGSDQPAPPGTTEAVSQSAAAAPTTSGSPDAKPLPAPSRSAVTPGPADTASRSPAPDARALPESGSGDFRLAPGESARVGRGQRLTYAVEVEDGVPLDPSAVARTVDDVLSDRRGWTAVEARTLQRVDNNPAIRIRLATPETTDRLCAPLATRRRLSCRNGGMVVLNAWRWLNGADTFAADLVAYRAYMVNHEFGHALGNRHESCPGRGQPAPVMVQQTKELGGCRPNPWPTVA